MFVSYYFIFRILQYTKCELQSVTFEHKKTTRQPTDGFFMIYNILLIHGLQLNTYLV